MRPAEERRPGTAAVSGFDFDTPVDRGNSSSLKWEKYRGRDILPLWVADMDFVSPPAVVEALKVRADHGVFGYTLAPASLVATVLAHLQAQFAWRVEPEWLVWLPGLVSGLNAVCRAVGQTGDQVLTCTPVYPPFLSAPELMGRRTLAVPLACEGDRWRLDIEAMARSLTPQTRLLLLCSPHNPVGRLWTREELLAVAELAERHDLVVCSDEIHAGLVLDPGRHHLPLAALAPETARRTITLQAPSKTYNLPGLGCSFAVVPDSGLRRQLHRAMEGIVPHGNLMGYVAAEAAYRHGEPWRLALLDYLRANRDLITAAVARMAGVRVAPVEATYLAWIDLRPTGIKKPGLFFEQAGVGLSDGADFGAPGFVRLNFGCPRAILNQALLRMEQALLQR